MVDASSQTLFLSNLPFTITDDELTEALTPYGTVVSIRKITNRYLGRRVPNGVAFVEFANASQMNAASSASLSIGGRTIVTAPARPRTVRTRDSAFVSGIPEGTTKKDLLEAFAGYNAVDARVSRANSAAGRGFGFVKFASEDAQELAVLSCTHVMIRGEESVVRFANRGYNEIPPKPIGRRRGMRTPRRVPVPLRTVPDGSPGDDSDSDS
jgi:RNA recognition motif-containing protein